MSYEVSIGGPLGAATWHWRAWVGVWRTILWSLRLKWHKRCSSVDFFWNVTNMSTNGCLLCHFNLKLHSMVYQTPMPTLMLWATLSLKETVNCYAILILSSTKSSPWFSGIGIGGAHMNQMTVYGYRMCIKSLTKGIYTNQMITNWIASDTG
jgi:hypothetical protein